MERNNLKTCLRAAYKLQNLRVKFWLQILSKLKAENPNIDRDIKNKVTSTRKIERELLAEYKSYESLDRSDSGTYIKDEVFFIVVQAYFVLHQQEEQMMKVISRQIADHPLLAYFKAIRGCDELTAAICLAEIDIRRSQYISSLYMLCGLDCGPDGKARNKTAAHLVERKYIDKDGKEKTKMSVTFSPFLHDKMLGMIGPNLIRSKSEPYYKTYTNYKHRLEMRPDWKDKSKMHRHRAALRYMMRTFVANLYNTWREIEGLQVFTSYEAEKLYLHHWKGNRLLEPMDCDREDYENLSEEEDIASWGLGDNIEINTNT